MCPQSYLTHMEWDQPYPNKRRVFLEQLGKALVTLGTLPPSSSSSSLSSVCESASGGWIWSWSSWGCSWGRQEEEMPVLPPKDGLWNTYYVLHMAEIHMQSPCTHCILSYMCRLELMTLNCYRFPKKYFCVSLPVCNRMWVSVYSACLKSIAEKWLAKWPEKGHIS